MFCCTRKQQHFGEVVNVICLEEDGTKNKNQLACPLCVVEEHKNHSISTMKKMIPQFLAAHRQKQKYMAMLDNLLNFTIQHFGQQNNQGQNVLIQNLIDRAIQIMSDLKIKVQNNNQQVIKMKQIFKNLNKNSTLSQNNSPIKSSSTIFESQKQAKTSNHLSSPSKITKSTVLGMNSNTKSKSNNNNLGTIDTFSHILKHPYLSLSNEHRTVIKSSHPGHRYAVLASKSLSSSSEEHEIHIKIDYCPSNNIMLGLCHESILKQKDFINNYGTNQGTYLIGQNGNCSSAISFHHCINMMNRKQIVGWNFQQNDIVTVGFNFNQHYMYFKVQKGKSKAQQFTMALVSEDNNNKHTVKDLVEEYGLKVVVLLQNVGDQVTLLQS